MLPWQGFFSYQLSGLSILVPAAASSLGPGRTDAWTHGCSALTCTRSICTSKASENKALSQRVRRLTALVAPPQVNRSTTVALSRVIWPFSWDFSCLKSPARSVAPAAAQNKALPCPSIFSVNHGANVRASARRSTSPGAWEMLLRCDPATAELISGCSNSLFLLVGLHTEPRY